MITLNDKMFIAFMSTLLLATVSLWFGSLSDQLYKDLMVFVAPLYFAGKFGSEYVEKQKEVESIEMQRKLEKGYQ